MRVFSDRVSPIEPSRAFAVREQVNELEAEGVDIVDLSIGEPDFVAAEHVREAVKDALDRGETKYTDPKGIPEFRQAIARKLRRENDLEVEAEEVYVTPGSKQALFESIFALLEPGDEVVLFDPAWVSYDPIITLAGGWATHVPLTPESGFTLEGVDLSEAITDDTKLVIVNTPSIAGSTFSLDELRQIRDLAVDHDVVVLSDEIYEKFVYDVEHRSIGALDGMAERTITTNGFSKSYAMAGFRLGYVTAPDDVMTEIIKVQSHTVSCATSFAQYGGIAALEGPQDHVEEMCRTYRSRRDAIVEALDDEGIDVPAPTGAFFLFLPVDGDDERLAREVLREERVAVMPGSAYSVPGYLRVCYTTEAERAVTGVRRIAPYIRSGQ